MILYLGGCPPGKQPDSLLRLRDPGAFEHVLSTFYWLWVRRTDPLSVWTYVRDEKGRGR